MVLFGISPVCRISGLLCLFSNQLFNRLPTWARGLVVADLHQRTRLPASGWCFGPSILIVHRTGPTTACLWDLASAGNPAAVRQVSLLAPVSRLASLKSVCVFSTSADGSPSCMPQQMGRRLAVGACSKRLKPSLRIPSFPPFPFAINHHHLIDDWSSWISLGGYYSNTYMTYVLCTLFPALIP